MIEIKNLTKNYGNFKAVDNISLTAKDGNITVLLGPNGAGKSTTIKSICGLLKFDGEILIDGYDNHTIEAKRVFGYIPEAANLYENLTINEHIKFIKKAYGVENDEYVNKLIKLFELEEKMNKPTKELSKGMKQKVSMLLGLISEPKSLLVDEPMIGLDPNAIENTLKLLVKLKDEGVAIFISTHIIDIIDGIYDEAYIMNHGKIEAHLVKSELKDETLKDEFFKITKDENHE